MPSKKAFPLWEQTKEKYVKDIWAAQEKLISFQYRRNPRDLQDLAKLCTRCWMNIRSYRDLLEKKAENKPLVTKLENMIGSEPNGMDLAEWSEIWKFLNDSYKRLGIDDVGKREDEDDYKTAVLEGLFD